MFRGTLNFDASPVVIPSPPAEGPLRVTSPFLLTGSIAGFHTVDATAPLFTVDLARSGIGRLVLEQR